MPYTVCRALTGIFNRLFGGQSKKGLTMNHNLPEAKTDSTQLHIIQGPDETPVDEFQVVLEEERKLIDEQAKAEEFWAGRNLAGRNSTRKAA